MAAKQSRWACRAAAKASRASRGADPHLTRGFQQGFFGLGHALGKVDQRRDEARAAAAQTFECLPEGGLQIIGLTLHQGADLGLRAAVFVQVGHGLEVRQKDEVRGRFGLE